MYRYMAGIDTDAEQPGFQHVVIRPQPGGSLTWVQADYDSLYGTISVEWSVSDRGTFRLQVKVPANAAATVYVPGSGVQVDGVEIQADSIGTSVVNGCYPLGEADGVSRFRIGSGIYVFESAGFPA